jgi:hypothetical protein
MPRAVSHDFAFVDWLHYVLFWLQCDVSAFSVQHIQFNKNTSCFCVFFLPGTSRKALKQKLWAFILMNFHQKAKGLSIKDTASLTSW